MKRTQINLPGRMHSEITRIAAHMGISMSELIRRILDDYLSRI